LAFVKNLTVESNVSSLKPLKTANGTPVLNFSIPLSISGKLPGDPEYHNSDTLWINCAIWGKTAEAIAPHLRDGDKVRVTGGLRGNAYNSQDGVKVSINMTVEGFCFVERAASNNAAGQNGYNNTDGYNASTAPAPAYAAPAPGWGSEVESNGTWNAGPNSQAAGSDNGAWDPKGLNF
jgi:single-stranded DNA-binding protein